MDANSFLFVQETGTGPQGKIIQSQIRAHVMDRVMTQKWLSKHEDSSDEDERPQRRKPASLKIRNHQSRSVKNKSFRLCGQYLPNSHLASLNRIEDMLRLSGQNVEMNTQSKFLLYHFLNYQSKSLCAVTAETGWLTYALRDSALFDSTLYHWASLNFDSLPAEFRTETSLLQLKGATIRKINERLNTAEQSPVSDENIASVACLANVTLMLGDVAEAHIHFTGLSTMVGSRKGVHMLGYQGLIARLVKWIDSCYAQLSNTELSFREHDIPIEESHPLPPVSLSTKSPFRLSESNIIHKLRSFSAELISSPRENLTTGSRVDLGKRFLASDRELLTQIHNNASSLFAIVATAALLYSQGILRGMNCNSRVIVTLASQLKESVTSALLSEDDIFAEDQAVLVWVLLVGVLTSGKRSQLGIWFDWCLKSVFNFEGLSTWEEKIQKSFEAPSHLSSQRFDWIFNEDVLQISAVNTRFLIQ